MSSETVNPKRLPEVGMLDCLTGQRAKLDASV
jgi:hypothetical protein